MRAMWNRAERFLWTGTLGGNPGEDPNLINTGNIPEDVQTWAMLSLGDRRYDPAVDWVTENLANTDGAVSGVTYSSQAKVLTGPVSGSTVANNRNAVWLEGNGHTALALLKRDDRGDTALAKRLLRQTVVAQRSLGAGQTVGLTADPDRRQALQPGRGRHLDRHPAARRAPASWPPPARSTPGSRSATSRASTSARRPGSSWRGRTSTPTDDVTCPGIAR